MLDFDTVYDILIAKQKGNDMKKHKITKEKKFITISATSEEQEKFELIRKFYGLSSYSEVIRLSVNAEAKKICP